MIHSRKFPKGFPFLLNPAISLNVIKIKTNSNFVYKIGQTFFWFDCLLQRLTKIGKPLALFALPS